MIGGPPVSRTRPKGLRRGFELREQRAVEGQGNALPQPSPLLIVNPQRTRCQRRRGDWWASRESNTAPTDYESAALTKHELEAHCDLTLRCETYCVLSYTISFHASLETANKKRVRRRAFRTT